jgi:hypothetical protein
MTDRIFEDARTFEVSSKGSFVEVYVFGPETSDRALREVMIIVNEEARWDSQRVNFVMTAAEATRMKEFLIAKGY